MKFLKLASAATALVLSTSANAALIDNGTYTTDDVTGLEWLDLSITDAQAYSSAETLNSGWRYATNAEVVNLFETMFDGYYDTNLTSYSSRSFDGAYADQQEDVARFQELFGLTHDITHYEGRYDQGSYGMYRDEDGILRFLGAFDQTDENEIFATSVLGTEYYLNYDDCCSQGHQSAGIFMVSAVPVPAAVWLFGSGLIGLVGFARRKKA